MLIQWIAPSCSSQKGKSDFSIPRHMQTDGNSGFLF